MKMEVMQKDEFQEFMKSTKDSTYANTTAQVIHMFELLWTSQKIVKLRQWIRVKARHPLKMSDFELSRILEFNLKSLGCTGLKERLNALINCISKFGDHKTITLQHMGDILGCSSTQLDELLEELFLKLKGGTEFYIYRSLIYYYERSSFMDKLTREKVCLSQK
jgi:hypothetical protein